MELASASSTYMQAIANQIIVEDVTNHFMATGKTSTVKEIAKRLTISENTVRRVVGDQCMELDCTIEHRPVKAVAAYSPSKRHLVNMIRSLQAT